VQAYRSRMGELAAMGPLDVWYDRIDVATVLAIAKQEQAKDLRRQLRVARVGQRTSLRVLPKLTTGANSTWKIIDDPPLIGHLDPETFDGAAMIASYAKSLPPDRRPLLERYCRRGGRALRSRCCRLLPGPAGGAGRCGVAAAGWGALPPRSG
jgi:Uncharacterized protein conserved in bacteria (DUF2252)